MVKVAVHVSAAAALQELAGLRRQTFGQHLQALVGLAPACGAAAIEHRNAHEFAHGRKAEYANLAGLAAR